MQEFPGLSSNELAHNAMALTSTDLHKDVTTQGNVALCNHHQGLVGGKKNSITITKPDATTEKMTIPQARKYFQVYPQAATLGHHASKKSKKGFHKPPPANPVFCAPAKKSALSNPLTGQPHTIAASMIASKNSHFACNHLLVNWLDPKSLYKQLPNLDDEESDLMTFVSPSDTTMLNPQASQVSGTAVIELQQTSQVNGCMTWMHMELLKNLMTLKCKAYIAMLKGNDLPKCIAADTISANMSMPNAVSLLLEHYAE